MSYLLIDENGKLDFAKAIELACQLEGEWRRLKENERAEREELRASFSAVNSELSAVRYVAKKYALEMVVERPEPGASMYDSRVVDDGYIVVWQLASPKGCE